MNKYVTNLLLLAGLLCFAACDDSDQLSIFPEAMRCLLVHRQDSITLLSLTTRQPHGSLALMPQGLMWATACMTT